MKANYNVIFKEILNVVPNGNTALKVMNILKQQGVVEGKLTEPIEWIFNFSGGGWNTVYALNEKEAQKKMKEQYETLNPLYHSVRPSSRADYEAHMRNFD